MNCFDVLEMISTFYISYTRFIAREFVSFNILNAYVPFPTQKLAAQIEVIKEEGEWEKC